MELELVEEVDIGIGMNEKEAGVAFLFKVPFFP
jgi:hypothetical protein